MSKKQLLQKARRYLALSRKEVKIHKKRRCFGCNRIFPVGTTLEKIVTINNSVFTTTYWCDVCRIYWTKYMRWDDKVMAGELRDNDPKEWERIYLKRKNAVRNETKRRSKITSQRGT